MIVWRNCCAARCGFHWRQGALRDRVAALHHGTLHFEWL